MLYRIQDRDGRGPWRPGFSIKWIDPEKDDRLCPPIQVEFPDWQSAIRKASLRGLHHFGCCVEGVRGLHQWFTPAELDRLRGFGFTLVDASALKPVCRGRYQIIGASRLPLSFLPAVDWAVAA